MNPRTAIDCIVRAGIPTAACSIPVAAQNRITRSCALSLVVAFAMAYCRTLRGAPNDLAIRGKLQSEIARTLGVSVMTLHRWRKAPPGPQPAHEVVQPGRTRGAGDRIAQLQLENSQVRRLVPVL